ncbi:MAG: excinuclease ABC subunit UvrA [bacterium]
MDDNKDYFIRIKGARQNNLKGFDCRIPLNQITVITGVSGSGKSSLAFDTLYAEGQRRYIETFSPYARQFMDRMDKPNVESIEGIPPAIAIEQGSPVRTSRSTVGTITELTDFTKLLFARIGELYCRNCSRKVIRDTPDSIWEALSKERQDSRIIIAFPCQKGDLDPKLVREGLMREGFSRVIEGEEVIEIESSRLDSPSIKVVVDRLVLKQEIKSRAIDSIEQALRFGHGRALVKVMDNGTLMFSSHLHCAYCDINYKDPMPNLFSFNSPLGACSTCRGFGRTIDIDLEKVIPNPRLSLESGAIRPWDTDSHEYRDLIRFCNRSGIPVHIPFNQLKEEEKQAIIEGGNGFYGVKGFFRWLESKSYKMHVRVFLSRYRGYFTCPVCRGARFKPEALLYRIGNLNIAQIYSLSIERASDFFEKLSKDRLDDASSMIMTEITNRLRYLNEIGLSYLALDRQSRTLSGGEVERVSLTKALGSSLVNTLYVLDEPSVGLHPRDSKRLVRLLNELSEHNTVIVVEHDPEIIRGGHNLLDLGPGAGKDGGRVVYSGPISEIHTAGESTTIDYLTGRSEIPIPPRRRQPEPERFIRIYGCSEHNLKNIDISIPLGLMVCITGVSGSGKSTLAEDIIFKGIRKEKGFSAERPGMYNSMEGLDNIENCVLIDQSPIGRTPRSNPLTYIGAFDPIRKLLSQTPVAKERGYKPGIFSFNVPGGRCETCMGNGFEKVEMQFLSDIFITCPDCKGLRFRREVLDVTYKGKSVGDILGMTLSEANAFFADIPAITAMFKPIMDSGLEYLCLGQPINTLSGGEAQRLKLSKHLGFRSTRNLLYIFDEPSTGLHFSDIKKLMDAFQRLVKEGKTLLIIEHNMDIVKCADYIIDLGPEGGENGGRIVAEGTPEKASEVKDSHTGRFLRRYLKRSASGRLNTRTLTIPKVIQSNGNIKITGAKEHNLKNITVTIPRNKMVVITGISGSGKSTLAFDVLFAEGQRRYIESLPTYVRQYLKIMERSNVDLITGIPPTVAIEQRMNILHRRSTVATITEIYHYLRLLFSKIGTLHCRCGKPLSPQSEEDILNRLIKYFNNHDFMIMVPKVIKRKGVHKDIMALAAKKGYTHARVDGTVVDLETPPELDRYKEHSIDIVIDRVKVLRENREQLASSVFFALNEGKGQFYAIDTKNNHEEIFSRKGFCPRCETAYEPIDPRLFSFNSRYGGCSACDGLGTLSENGSPCPECNGKRLNERALSVKIADYTIADMSALTVEGSIWFFPSMRFSEREQVIADLLIPEILARLEFLKKVGLSYLSLDRSGDTLSGGETQRIRLAAQLGSNLIGVCYILDEPTIGLHPRDNAVLLDTLLQLRDRGNSVIVVEHDEETIRRADHVLDLGPEAGIHGGRIVAQGTPDSIQNEPGSVTGRWLVTTKRQRITSRSRKAKEGKWLMIKGASVYNLKEIDVGIPLGTLVCITGVSGSGKSTLLREVILKRIQDLLRKKELCQNTCKAIEGWENLERILEVDHSPIGKTPRSTPGTYIGFHDAIRKLFAMLPESRMRGYKAGRFSFNTKGGRCEACAGQGRIKVEMSFLPDVYIDCEVCGCKRFNEETLNVAYRGKNIAEVLDLTIEEGLSLFLNIPKISPSLKLLLDMGLGYLKIGQASNTLSGGEAQRIKLAYELTKKSHGKTLYILDEPTTGLHLADIKKLMGVLQKLVDLGNTILVIEHNLDVIKEADYIIDLGPEGGEGGGLVVAQGSPWDILQHAAVSHTAKFLKKYLEPVQKPGKTLPDKIVNSH